MDGKAKVGIGCAVVLLVGLVVAPFAIICGLTVLGQQLDQQFTELERMQ